MLDGPLHATGASGVGGTDNGRMTPSFTWTAVTVDCADPQRLARFWRALLGGEVVVPLPGWSRLSGPGRPDLTFQPVPEPRSGKVRLHLDVVTDDLDAAIERVRTLGGTQTPERHDYPEGAVLVMTDPEGNEFCLVRYAPGSGAI